MEKLRALDQGRVVLLGDGCCLVRIDERFVADGFGWAPPFILAFQPHPGLDRERLQGLTWGPEIATVTQSATSVTRRLLLHRLLPFDDLDAGRAWLQRFAGKALSLPSIPPVAVLVRERGELAALGLAFPTPGDDAEPGRSSYRALTMENLQGQLPASVLAFAEGAAGGHKTELSASATYQLVGSDAPGPQGTAVRLRCEWAEPRGRLLSSPPLNPGTAVLSLRGSPLSDASDGLPAGLDRELRVLSSLLVAAGAEGSGQASCLPAPEWGRAGAGAGEERDAPGFVAAFVARNAGPRKQPNSRAPTEGPEPCDAAAAAGEARRANRDFSERFWHEVALPSSTMASAKARCGAMLAAIHEEVVPHTNRQNTTAIGQLCRRNVRWAHAAYRQDPAAAGGPADDGAVSSLGDPARALLELGLYTLQRDFEHYLDRQGADAEHVRFFLSRSETAPPAPAEQLARLWMLRHVLQVCRLATRLGVPHPERAALVASCLIHQRRCGAGEDRFPEYQVTVLSPLPWVRAASLPSPSVWTLCARWGSAEKHLRVATAASERLRTGCGAEVSGAEAATASEDGWLAWLRALDTAPACEERAATVATIRAVRL